jgi:hypothetical protein
MYLQRVPPISIAFSSRGGCPEQMSTLRVSFNTTQNAIARVCLQMQLRHIWSINLAADTRSSLIQIYTGKNRKSKAEVLNRCLTPSACKQTTAEGITNIVDHACTIEGSRPCLGQVASICTFACVRPIPCGDASASACAGDKILLYSSSRIYPAQSSQGGAS